MKNKKRLKKILIIIPIILICIIFIAWLAAFVYFTSSNIQKQFDVAVSSKNIHEAILFVEQTTGDFSKIFGYGGRDINSPIIIASVTKMFTTACILKLYEDGKLSLNDKISFYIDDEVIEGLHLYKDIEYSFELTISDLLFQTSGLPDYFVNLSEDIITSGDRYVSFEDLIEETKKLSPPFAPNSGKAHYADINFDLLGIILEKVTELPLEKIYEQFIFSPLEMNNTYLPVSKDDFVPHLFNGSEKIELPQYISSARASGGCVSTARDMMNFSKAFWDSELFDKSVLEQLSEYKRLQLDMSPIQYGGGYMRLSLDGLNTFFLAEGELIGHSGSTGSFMFYYPEKDLHIIGDFSQIANSGKPIQFVMRLAMALSNL